jgi:hypothetical protein
MIAFHARDIGGATPRRLTASNPLSVASPTGARRMEASRKPLAKIEGRKRMRLSGVTVAWRGTPSLDDWVAYIVNGTRSRKLILADHTSERRVKALLVRIQGLSKREVEKLAKG